MHSNIYIYVYIQTHTYTYIYMLRKLTYPCYKPMYVCIAMKLHICILVHLYIFIDMLTTLEIIPPNSLNKIFPFHIK